MELHGSYIVDVPLQSEEALFSLVIPNFDQLIVTPRHKHWLGIVESYSAHRTYI